MPHIGTVFQALIDYVIAKQSDGQFIIRLEDTDQSRLVQGAEEALYNSLEWAGLVPDEGVKYGGDFGPYKQSERLELYQQHLNTIIDNGHAYYCFCSPERLTQVRSDMQKAGQPPMYDKHCRDLDPAASAARAKTEAHTVRLKVPKDLTITVKDAIRGEISFESSVVDDQVILKSDGFPTYHLAVVVDDHLMKISHVVRGEEWLSSAPKHVLLYQAFGWPEPIWIHTPLLRNLDKSKLSKRHGHASVSWYTDQGYLPEAVINFMATRVWNHPQGKEIFTLADMVQNFKPEDMHIQGPIADLDKLNWYNGQYIRQLSTKEVLKRVKPYLKVDLDSGTLEKLIPLIQERLTKLSEINELVDFAAQHIKPETKILLKKSDSETVAEQLTLTIEKLSDIEDWSVFHIEAAIRSLQEKHDWKKGQYFMMLRVAATGKTATPPLFESIEVLGQSAILDRLNYAQKTAQKN